MIVGFSVALLLDQVSTFTRGIYLSLFLLPFVIVPIVGTMMFKQLFEPSGLLTYVYQVAREALKWLIGHKRPLRAERVRAYRQVLRTGLRGNL